MGRSLISWSRRNWRLVGLGALLLVGLGTLGAALMVEATSQPQFCGSCHIMKPYYDSWLTSSHKDVACVDCHIPPGLHSEIEKKKEAISMVVSYFTGTYGTNPWAEVEDAACLECHQRRLLSGKEVFKGILFDHEPHLTEMRREKKLRCTSCHSQIVQGSHISVETSTCVLCHFKEQAAGQGTAQCTLCHDVPEKIIAKGTLSFDHGDVKRFDMQCSWCHAHVTRGDGEAPKQRCYVCHNDVERLEKYGDHPLLHRIHVTDHKVECLHCHTEILHSGFAPRQELAATACATCHADGHSPQRDLYAGIGGKGVKPRPSAMHLAGIRCEGCHFLPREQGADRVQGADAVSCMACHGPRYRRMLDRWRELLDQRLALARQELAQARGLLGGKAQALQDAQANLLLVERGHGVHNVDYALDILAANHALLSAALRGAGRPSLAAWEAVPYDSDCLRCHQGIESQAGSFAGKPFAHRPHVLGEKMDCLRCHRPHQQRQASEAELGKSSSSGLAAVDLADTGQRFSLGRAVSLPPQECAPCHHPPSLKADCSRCHAQLAASLYQGKKFSHQYHLEEEELKCQDCHTLQERPGLKPNACADCHEEEE